MAQVDPSKNTNALLIGTGEFSFADGASTVVLGQAAGYVDFGNIAAFSPKTDTQKLEHKGAYRGVLRVDKTAVTESKVQYQLKCDEWNFRNLQILFGGNSTTAHTQLLKSAAAAETFTFTATPAVIGAWYDIKYSGVHYHALTTVTIAGKVEGTDFVVDLKLGRVKFLTAQAADLVPTVTSAAITSADDDYFLKMIPLNNVRRTGMGRLVCFDQYADNIVCFKHEDFSCEITLDSTDEIGGSAFSNITMTVSITDLPGTVWLRGANQNSGLSA